MQSNKGEREAALWSSFGLEVPPYSALIPQSTGELPNRKMTKVLLLSLLCCFAFCFGDQGFSKRHAEYAAETEGVVVGLTGLPVCLNITRPLNGFNVSQEFLFRYRGGATSVYGKQFYSGTFTSPKLAPGSVGVGYGIARKGTVNTVYAMDWPSDAGVTLVSANYCARDGKYTQLTWLRGPQINSTNFGDGFSHVTSPPVAMVPGYQIPVNNIFCARGSTGPAQVNCLSTRDQMEFTTRSPVFDSAPFCFRGPSMSNPAASIVYRLKGGNGTYLAVNKTAQYYEGYASDPNVPGAYHKLYAVAPAGARDLIVVVDWRSDAGLSFLLLTFAPSVKGLNVNDLDTAPLGGDGNALFFSGAGGSAASFSLAPVAVSLAPCV
eukprot:TRINITY_DN843_c0_g1_i3.p1 TRINITY_DN843_c0_g1~~TRINITY_DN843_c0_g1_i3.p1  ORF type:complete len:378 (+),score=126.28 TRINITY_DN843_c0_g1_i3:1138-2271(+)